VSASFDLDAPDHFTVGAVGAPGERVFYIQGRQDRRLVTLKSEKEQVRALATYLAQILLVLLRTTLCRRALTYRSRFSGNDAFAVEKVHDMLKCSGIAWMGFELSSAITSTSLERSASRAFIGEPSGPRTSA